ncbi:hypothetical protein [Aequorivita echinoideorum]|uniref:DUF3299 domain-containing protein n=1 Tax=Aequorivita echinoideorum TaxID=1549647 RepID=A0ABS5S2D3_9FLAO|nr:hypothetical protein [Aequorivita echinoideorum]MBT0607373.1 hypothetical protein [Aequorivita echinoideorum]
MRNKFAIAAILFGLHFCTGQEHISWQHLADVSFTDKYFPSVDQLLLYPTFGQDVKKLEGKEITLSGYFLNISPEDDLYILSKNPMAACFFCGMAGPETTVELHFKKKPNFYTDDIITVTGTLSLNSKDVTHLNYILDNCTAVKAK